MIYSLYILNKSGGVIFKQDSEHGRAHDDANDSLRMGSLFYSFNSHAENFAPVAPPGQITSMETDNFSLKTIYTDSGTIIIRKPEQSCVYQKADLFQQELPFSPLETPMRPTWSSSCNRCTRHTATLPLKTPTGSSINPCTTLAKNLCLQSKPWSTTTTPDTLTPSNASLQSIRKCTYVL